LRAQRCFQFRAPITKNDGRHQAYRITPVWDFGYSLGVPAKQDQPSYSMHLALTVSLILVEILLVIVLADFLAGVIHWAEDAYFTEDTPVIGPLFIRPNIVHHHFPRFFTRLSWWQSSWDLALIGGAILLIAWPLDLLSWQLGLFAVLSINANEVHKWSHRTRKENGRLISKLQDWHILQTPRHHGLHHSDPKNTYYCPITNLVNPVLERVHFWDHAEVIVEKLSGATHRPDTAVRGKGPGPEWLAAYRPVPKQPCATPCSACLKRADHSACPKAALAAI
jgi:ubiquitin-conjugating enzyme E2 variant